MTVHVHLFARFRDAFGTDAISVELPSNANVAGLRSAVAAMKGEIAALLQRSQVAVNGEFADENVILKPTDEIALIPPVSGG
jgi:molybdopterin converting factor subunit 1